MSRPVIVTPSISRRIRRDPRFVEATAQRPVDPSWRTDGLCLRQDPELFFPNSAEDPAPALAVCARCPVRAPCLAAALDSGEPDGVWGGTTPEERRPMRTVWLTPRPRVRT